ncbi:MAG: hypothetical protein ACTHJR_18900 [Sphingomonas sp.]|uniref:hypothetical protein n=1 Tax=Sphingomonas sp. TaxID=28214 RepID=UPI003F80C4C4
MRTIGLSTVLAGALCASVAAAAQDRSPSGTTPAPDTEKKICRTITPTGSIMGKRFCLTKAEWKKLNDINADNAETGLSARRLRNQKGDLES